jgi:hypothetical protein
MIDIDKTYHTRDGREVRIYAVDGRGGTAVHGAIKTCSGYWQQASWWNCGQSLTSLQSNDDLFEAKPRIQQTVWVNVYSNGFAGWVDRKTADANSSFTRLACVKVEIDCEEGEGL